MFSGIVEVTAKVREATLRNKGMRLVVGEVPFADALAPGAMRTSGSTFALGDRPPR